MPLCEICTALGDASWAGPSDFLLNHYRSYADLRASAQTGCSLCIMLRMGLLHHCHSYNDGSEAEESGESGLLLQVEVREAEDLLLAKTEPFYLQRVYSTVKGTGGIHGFEYYQGTFDPNPPFIRVIENIPPAFVVTTGHGNSPESCFLVDLVLKPW